MTERAAVAGRRSFLALRPAALIIIHLALASWAAFALSQTFDEALHLASGYGYWKSGEISADTNAPFARLVAALPLLRLDVAPLLEDPDHKDANLFIWGDRFLYHNRVLPEKMLHAGRLALILLLGPILAWTLYRWGSRAGGGEAGLAALFFYAFNPVVLANVSLITTDFAGALFVVLCLHAASRACEESPSRAWLWAAAGVFLGLALASKYSTVLLFAALPLGAALQLRLARRRPTAGEASCAVLALLGGALLALTAVYGPRGLLAWERGEALTFGRIGTGDVPTFLLGKVGENGWWYYFPFAFLVKTPLPLLLLIIAAVFTKFRERGALSAFAVLPAILWLGASCFSRFQVGVRHILPIFPLACLIAGVVFADLWRDGSALKRSGLLFLLVWYAAGTLRLAPDYLAYFNELAGGPEGGRRLLSDSNVDWGQSLGALGKFLHDEGEPPIYFSYFGTADPHFYGIRYVPVAWATPVQRSGDQVEPFRARKILFAVSATNLTSVYYHGTTLDMAQGLAAYKPYKILGHSILVYDLTDRPEALKGIAQILAWGNDAPRAQSLQYWLDRKGPIRARAVPTTFWNDALGKIPSTWIAANNLGKMSLERGDWVTAELRFKQAIQIDPNSYEAHYDLGFALRKQRRLLEAQTQFKTALDIKPDYADACYNLAVNSQDLGQAGAAELMLKKTLLLDPGYWEALNGLGILYLGQGKLDISERYFQQAISATNGKRYEPYQNLSVLYSRKGNLSLSREMMRLATELKR
jgi:Tfp pilus assembly protein PilF/4-amino-4-deoxy-L-arabinose transferase-like glycosyltransferase